MLQPLITIGIIFRNDIRCIERCLKALQPLRDACRSELIMADTGSTDGSREVAERYADILFDFPWIDDFAAARNAVMDRASGKWFFTVDTDEYLDPDISELLQVMRDRTHKAEAMALTVRNYASYEMDEDYYDFTGLRILRMSTGIRYHGKIHEEWRTKTGRDIKAYLLQRTVLHHDGYVALNQGGVEGAAKRQRNLTLLYKKLEEDPKSLFTLLQLIECSITQPEVVDYLRQAMELIDEKAHGWKKSGPPVYRYAVGVAKNLNLPEFDAWVQRARELFPKALHIRLDVEYVVSFDCWEKKDYSGCVEAGERSLAALADFRAGRCDPLTLAISALQKTTPAHEAELRLLIARACGMEMKFERAFQLLSSIDFFRLSAEQVRQAAQVIMEIHFKSDLDTRPLVTEFWNGITAEELSQDRIDGNKRSFANTLERAFSRKARERDSADKEFHRYAYTLVLPLETEFEMGRAAAILNTDDPQLLSEKLAAVKNWEHFSIHALGHALERGALFPPAGKQMNVEELDELAHRLLSADDQIIPMLTDPDAFAVDSIQSLCWARSLVLAAVQSYNWADDGADPETGLALARTFAQVEQEFLPLCYAPEALEEDRLFLLPPLHRFGRYCVQAFEALDAGDAAYCVRLLRTGLDVCKNAKDMVQFLLKHTPELQMQPESSAELLTLAGQIRAVLANFAPDDPAVVALKQSEAYRKVSYLIEGASVPVAGGLLQ